MMQARKKSSLQPPNMMIAPVWLHFGKTRIKGLWSFGKFVDCRFYPVVPDAWSYRLVNSSPGKVVQIKVHPAYRLNGNR